MSFWLISSLLILFLFSNNATDANADAAPRFELIHRHSPKLTENNVSNLGPPENKRERIKQLVHSDIARQETIADRLGRRRKVSEIQNSTSHLIKLPLRSAADTGTGQYFVSFRVGSPPQKFVLIADTASDVTWMHCDYSKCHDCKKGSKLSHGRVFHPNQSLSFKTIPCSSDICKVDLGNSFSLTTCPATSSPCAYDYRYVDGSRVTGFFGSDTVTAGVDILHKKVKLHDVMIGCSEWSEGTISGVDGVMGLGYGKHSFAEKAAKMFGNKFSYCLVDHLSPSNLVNYLHFGNISDSTLPNMKYTELILGVLGSFYAVNITGISMGGKMLEIPAQVWNAKSGGGVILDTGSTATYLVEPAFMAVTDAFAAATPQFPRIDFSVGPLEYCFKTEGYNEALVPKFVWHFADGTTFEPPVKSYVMEASFGAMCLGFALGKWPGTTVMGNIMQQNHFWEFDLTNRKLGFAPSTCTEFEQKI